MFKTKGAEVSTEQDKIMSKKLLKLWTQFAKDGDPGQGWERVSPDHGQEVKYAKLSTAPLKMAMCLDHK